MNRTRPGPIRADRTRPRLIAHGEGGTAVTYECVFVRLVTTEEGEFVFIMLEDDTGAVAQGRVRRNGRP